MTQSEKPAFNNEDVIAILRAALAEDDLPSRFDGPGIRSLTRYLNNTAWLVISWKSKWGEQEERNYRVAAAIAILAREIPLLIPDYISAANCVDPWCTPGSDALRLLAQDELAAMASLQKAALLASEIGLPVKFSPLAQPVESWPHYAKSMEAAFHSALPGRPKAAAYRFIQEATKILTKEDASLQGIKDRLGRKRPVNRSKRGRPLTRGKVQTTLLQ